VTVNKDFQNNRKTFIATTLKTPASKSDGWPQQWGSEERERSWWENVQQLQRQEKIHSRLADQSRHATSRHTHQHRTLG